jgi:hypothetical protein
MIGRKFPHEGAAGISVRIVSVRIRVSATSGERPVITSDAVLRKTVIANRQLRVHVNIVHLVL